MEDPTYYRTEREKQAGWRFSPFAISHSLYTNGDGTGVCMIHNRYGVVCLIRNAGDTDVETYRIKRTTWEANVRGGVSEAALAANIRATHTAISVANGYVDYMDVYHCNKLNTDRYVCSAFQPDWKKGR